MRRFRCNGCGGEYGDEDDQGIGYAHVCPPITLARVNRAGEWKFVPLGNIRPTDTITVHRNDADVDILVSEVQPGDVRLNDRTAPRPPDQHRDENAEPADVIQGPRDGRARRIRAEGAGRTAL